MKTPFYRFLLLVLLLLSGSSPAQPVRQAWVQRYALDPSKTNLALSILQASDGNLIVGGSSTSTNGDLDYLLMSYTPNGTQAWLTRYDSTNHVHDQMRGLVLGSNGTIVVTGTSKTAEFASSGNLLWSAPYGGRAVAVNGSNVYVTGFSDVDFATAKLDGASGSNQWIRTHDCIGLADVSQVIAVDVGGNVYVSGDEFAYYNPRIPDIYHNLTTLKYDATGTVLWVLRNDGSPYLQYHSAEAKGLWVGNAGGFCVMGNCPGQNTYLTRRFDANTELMWYYVMEIYGGVAAGGQGTSMTVDENNNVYLTGSVPVYNTILSKDCGTVRLGVNGAKMWLSIYHGVEKGTNQGTGLALDATGSVYVCGYSPGTGTGHDIFTVKYDRNGQQLWVQRYNGPANGDDIATGLVVDASGNVYVTGYSAATNGGTEFVTIKYLQPPPIDIQRRSDGAMRLQTLTTPGVPYAFESSSNLQTWLPLATNTADTNGLAVFDDTNAPALPRRFYRGNGP